MRNITRLSSVTTESIFTSALEGYIDRRRLDAKEASRKLTNRETMEQGIATVKLILFGSAALAITLDRFVTVAMRKVNESQL